MSEIRAVFFWLSGVFTPPLLTLVALALRQAGEKPVNPLAIPNFTDLVEALTTGQLGGLEFCQKLGEPAWIESSPAVLQDRILENIIPNQGALAIPRLLPKHLQCWLVVDLPGAWFERIRGPVGVDQCFAPVWTISLPASRLPKLIPDAFHHLASQAQLPLDECLLIDASARRAVQALRHGLPTEIFIDARRLERMLVLRKLIDRPHPVHKPDTSL